MRRYYKMPQNTHPIYFSLKLQTDVLTFFSVCEAIDLLQVKATIHGLFARWKFGFVFTFGCGTSNIMCTSFSTLRSRSLQGGLIPTYGCKKK